MKLYFKQRFFSWLDSYDVYDEDGTVKYTVEGQLAFGHKLHILNPFGEHIATLRQEILTFTPQFSIYQNEELVGSISKEIFSFFKPKYDIDYKGWYMEGDLFEWDYQVFDADGELVATISKELFNWTDTYVLDIEDPNNALHVLLLVLAIDAEKCSRD